VPPLHYADDGGGKVTLQSEYVVERREGEALLRNFQGKGLRVPGAGGGGLLLPVWRGVTWWRRLPS
jgi:hypothetical protein